MERPKQSPLSLSHQLAQARGDDRAIDRSVVALERDELGHVKVAAQANTPEAVDALLTALAAEGAAAGEEARKLARTAHGIFSNGYGDRDAAMLALVAAFHGLRPYVTHGAPERADGRPPLFDPMHFAKWAKRGLGSGALDAARFVLLVWNTKATYGLGRFELMHALGNWDVEHRGAFLGWAEAPWWP